jgi:hypothetical protein
MWIKKPLQVTAICLTGGTKIHGYYRDYQGEVNNGTVVTDI